MAACLQAGVPLIVSDAKHTPCGMLLPFHQHYQQAGVARRQIAASAPLRKRLWQTIVRQQIFNQAANLDRGQIEGGHTLREMANKVKSGDPRNVEARAARYYWPCLLEDFRRHDDADVRNAMLNYGYAVLRAASARALVAAGLLPAFGIHHDGAQNAFNLADDILEVLRPVADWKVFAMTGQGRPPSDDELTKEQRQELLSIMTESVVVEDEQLTVLPALDRTVASLVRALSGGDHEALVLPQT